MGNTAIEVIHMKSQFASHLCKYQWVGTTKFEMLPSLLPCFVQQYFKCMKVGEKTKNTAKPKKHPAENMASWKQWRKELFH